MSTTDQKIGALSTFLQKLDKLGTKNKPLRFFRGHAKRNFQLKPSIFRNSGWISNEATMLHELILRCPNDFTGGLTTFQSLVKMQHYGLPTRLLDVTSNPLVALYFACEPYDEADDDGEVMVFGYDVEEVKYFDSDTVSVIANLSRRPSDFRLPVLEDVDAANPEEAIRKFNEDGAIKLLLHDIRNDKPHFLPEIRRGDLERAICVKPMLDNPRIIRQEGAFLLFGCDKIKTEPAKLDQETIIHKLIINRFEKQNIRNQLHKLGISRATIYPEIEHVAMHVKQSYSVASVDLAQLSSVQKAVFEALRLAGTSSVPDLARAADVSPSTTARAVSELQKMGAISLTNSGRERCWKLADNLDICQVDKQTFDDALSEMDNV